MSFDRAKALESAQKYLAKGQLDRAITEYERLVQADPKDSRLLLKLGDLYTRQGAARDASATYRKVAEQYAEQGFFLKAVAVCKQVLKLDPGQVDVWERLAEMYEMLSLGSDAVAAYEQVAETSTRANNPRKALRALQKIAELDPENVAARIRYAEALSKLNKPEEAAAAFREGADLLKQQGRIDDYLKVGERLLFHQPEDHAFARELAATYLERDNAKHALVKLQACFNADPKNIDTLHLLARAFEQLGQTAKTISVLKEVARLHAQNSRSAEQGSVLRRILALDPKDAEARRDLSGLKNVPEERAAEAAEVEEEEDYDLLLEDDESNLVEETPVTAEQSDTLDEQAQAKVVRLLDECAVFIRYGLTEKMITQLQEVLSIDPRHVDAREKLKDAYLKARRPAEAIEQLIFLFEQVRSQDAERAKAYLNEALRIDPKHEQAKRLFSTLLLGHSNRPAAATRAPAPPSTYEAKTATIPRDLPPAADEHAEESFASVMPDDNVEAQEEQEEEVGDGPTVELVVDDSAAATQLDEADVVFEDEPEEAAVESYQADAEEGAYEQAEPIEQVEPVEQVEAVEDVEPAEEVAYDEAEPHSATYQVQSSQRAAQLGEMRSPPPLQPESAPPAAVTSIPPAPGASAPPAHLSSVPPVDAAVPEALREVLEEIEFYISQEMLEEAQATLADALASFPGHPLLLARQLELGQGAEEQASPAESSPAPVSASGQPASQPSAAPVREDRSFELAQKLAEEVSPATTRAAAQAPLEMADVLAQFKQGVAKQVDKSDAATHYDLGIAYMEMGLHSEAIDEFKLTLVDPARRCTAHTMIGLSYVANGDMDLGVEHLKLALEENPRPEEELGLWFELGNAYELVGKNIEALGWYEKVEARDPQFRDVAVRIQRLNAARSPEQEADEFDEMFDNMIMKE